MLKGKLKETTARVTAQGRTTRDLYRRLVLALRAHLRPALGAVGPLRHRRQDQVTHRRDHRGRGDVEKTLHSACAAVDSLPRPPAPRRRPPCLRGSRSSGIIRPGPRPPSHRLPLHGPAPGGYNRAV